MICEQYYLECLSQASYLIGDEETGTAIIIDPRRDVDLYVTEAERRGLTIRHVFLTHFHADFVSGHLELRERTGAEIHLGAAATAEYPFTPAKDGDRLEIGRIRLEVLETPGHTPESISIVIFDLDRSSEQPCAVCTGDALFVGDVGRPDLLVSVGMKADELAGMLYDSLHEKLLKLPDETLVYPAHGAGSACGKNLGTETFSTIGNQRAHNYALQPMERTEFITQLTTGLSTPPAYFTWDASYNRVQRPTLDAALEKARRALPLGEVLRLQNAGACVLDVRDPAVYAARHLAGSTNVGLGGRFASWCGTVLERDQSLVIVAEPGREQEALLRLGRIGFDQTVGYLEGGPAAFADRDDLVRGHPRVTPTDVAARLASEAPPVVLDVRKPVEWEAGHIEASRNTPLDRLADEVKDLDRETPLVIHCQTGYRSSIASSQLEQLGFTNIGDLEGGWVAWQESELPVM
jgi:glyoxylase-like metal-dependent hydrolase (beta-lactamase superfamily II)/rhodanese-related sulfurtransferase